MSKERGVTLRAQWLGQLLRDLREQKGFTLKDAGEYLQRTGATVSRFETGVYPIRRVDTAALLDLYGVEDPKHRDMLLQLAGELWQTGWWESYADDAWSSTIDLAWLEDRAVSLRLFAGMVVPGLLQTREYALALFSATSPDMSAHRLTRGVDLRQERQQILHRDTPPQITAVIDEAALRRTVGSNDVMAGQLRHLRQMMDLPQVEINVLPFELGAHASPEGSFALIGLAAPFSDIAHSECPGGAIYLERTGVDRLVRVYDQLRGTSLDAEKSAAFLAALEKDLS
ncbi:helix-turn-helix transcriptional regulator [Lipingzhangella sp. LS1_29]|uniref:Helix-turn-helix transcriptional regulator n=1 Tax=Lipingzhangella rawalii TaxID=2055835 RepID=A0ABU2H1A1_9ACTN|nr:helix-turn-helix transcriptional regulator [Lipingzhangella rawalii]MDS1269073.1 helix-turn-helix transcriptional regulator [Lipingzhangella rawalii]